ncbi:hypothetical protein Hanom_Chr16g01464321 [Helianthus anomalus]
MRKTYAFAEGGRLSMEEDSRCRQRLSLKEEASLMRFTCSLMSLKVEATCSLMFLYYEFVLL